DRALIADFVFRRNRDERRHYARQSRRRERAEAKPGDYGDLFHLVLPQSVLEKSAISLHGIADHAASGPGRPKMRCGSELPLRGRLATIARVLHVRDSAPENRTCSI